MGLFDNLFLDANTPITINDGIDHSKDVVQPIVDPIVSPESSGDSLAVPVTSEPSDAGLVELFDSDTEEEKTATEILHPEPPKDIALEIGLGTPEASLGDASADIDIGGDISFDIGGDMSSGVSFVDGSATDSGAPLTSTEVALSNPIEAIADTSGVANTLTEDGLTPSPDTPSDTALFSLLNNDPSSGEGPSPEAIPSASLLGDIGSGPVQSGDIVFSPLFDMSPDVPASSEPEIGSSKEVSPLPSPMRESSVPVQSALTSLTTSPKLKAKISQFLGELESMEFGDQSEKEHKKQQLEMMRLRITEIRAESEMRIHALQMEMQTLEREILDMDTEKSRIKNVIESFQKELDAV